MWLFGHFAYYIISECRKMVQHEIFISQLKHFISCCITYGKNPVSVHCNSRHHFFQLEMGLRTYSCLSFQAWLCCHSSYDLSISEFLVRFRNPWHFSLESHYIVAHICFEHFLEYLFSNLQFLGLQQLKGRYFSAFSYFMISVGAYVDFATVSLNALPILYFLNILKLKSFMIFELSTIEFRSAQGLCIFSLDE